MTTLTIQIKNDKALKLIKDIEALDLIKVIKNSSTKKTKKLSERLSGCITEKQGAKMHKELEQMRNEWERDI